MMGRAAWLGPALAGLLVLVGDAGGAVAHAVLVESRPADGASLREPPQEIELRFNEPVTPVAVRLLTADGRELPDIAVQMRGDTILLRPARPLPAGGYFLSYRVTSLDAHGVGATLRFGVATAAPGGAEHAAESRTVAWAAALGRWLFYAAALGAAGAALFAVLVGSTAAIASLVRGLAALALGTLALRLGSAGLDLGGLPPAAILTTGPWRIAAGSSLGAASAVAGLGLMAMLLRNVRARLMGSLTVAVSFALTGHAASAEPRLLTGPALGLHVLAGAFWLGSLLPLLWTLRQPPARAAAVFRRFSRRATAAVAILVAAGAALAWVQLGGSAAALVETGYGRTLLVKLALVGGLLVLAAINRLALTPALARGDARGLRWSLTADIALGLAVLAVTATFPLSPPPRALAHQDGGLTVVVSGRDGQATLTLIPGRVGANRLEAAVVDAQGASVAAREITAFWSLPEAGIEPARVAARQPTPGVVAAEGIALPQSGRWRLRLDLLVDDFTKLTYEGAVDVP